MIIAYLTSKSAVQYMKHFIYHFTIIIIKIMIIVISILYNNMISILYSTYGIGIFQLYS